MIIPSESDVLNYGLSIGFRINAQKFLNYYEMKGWMVGRTKMKDWKAAVRLWKINSNESELFKPVPKEPEENRNARLLKDMKCYRCKGGKIEKNEDDGMYRCSQCNCDYTKEIK